MRSRLVTWQWHLDAEVPATLELDFTQVRFMEPWALSMWAAFGIHQRQRGAVVRCRFDPDNPANQYMVATGLGAAMETATTTTALAEWQDSARNTGLHLLRTEADLGVFRPARIAWPCITASKRRMRCDTC
jgi:hypothetical protein